MNCKSSRTFRLRGCSREDVNFQALLALWAAGKGLEHPWGQPSSRDRCGADGMQALEEPVSVKTGTRT